MISAIDTNILLDILIPIEKFWACSADALQKASNSGSLVVCDIVYAEVCIHFPGQMECDGFFEINQIRIEPLSKEAHFLASRAWRTYHQQGGQRTRILADFLIGAHAQTQATHLVTRDRGFYRKMFSALKIVDPAAGKNAN
jgi:predicted nucleic acid-binding protein